MALKYLLPKVLLRLSTERLDPYLNEIELEQH